MKKAMENVGKRRRALKDWLSDSRRGGKGLMTREQVDRFNVIFKSVGSLSRDRAVARSSLKLFGKINPGDVDRKQAYRIASMVSRSLVLESADDWRFGDKAHAMLRDIAAFKRGLGLSRKEVEEIESRFKAPAWLVEKERELTE